MAFRREVVAERIRSVIGGESTRQVEARSGLSFTTVAGWLNGRALPGAEALASFCLEYDVSADYLLGLSDEKQLAKVIHPKGEGKSTVRQFRRKDDRVGRMTAKELARVLAASGVKLDERTTLEELIRIVVRVMRAEQAG